MKRHILAIAAAALLGGCMSSAIHVTFTDSNAAVGFLRIEGDALAPGFGSESGPRLVAKIGKNQPALVRMKGYATLTNVTQFAGIYTATENKILSVDMTLAATNTPPGDLP